MATHPGRMASGTVVYIPAANIIQAGEQIPGAVTQPAGAVQYMPYVSQQVGSASNQPQPEKTWEKFLKMETKTLGTVQILIGLMQIGFGALLLCLLPAYISFAAIGGYPFWGGAFFIVSGSMSVSAEKHQTRCLAKCTVGMHVTSSVMSAAGIILYISDLAFSRTSLYYWTSCIGFGLSFLLLLFSLLEFCITVLMSHIGCQENFYNPEMAMVFVPYSVSCGASAPTENNLAPPHYDAMDFSPKTE